jgi:hypothetical protein
LTTFVIPRHGQKNFEDMMAKWNWVEKNFGKCSYDKSTWTWYWHDDTEDFVEFVFYNEAIATWFVLQFPEVLTLEQFERKQLSME